MRARPSAVSSPSIPGGAWSNGASFASWVCGAWSVAMQSIVPSARPARTAATSASVRSGGFTLNTGSYDAHSAWVSVKWWVVASQVTGRPAGLGLAHHRDRPGRGQVLEVHPACR